MNVPYSDLADDVERWRFHDLLKVSRCGVSKTFDRIAMKYYWPKMRSDGADCIRHCETCAHTKPKPVGLMGVRSQIC